MIRLPGVCRGCRRDVVWTGRVWKDATNLHRRHVCPFERPMCGVLMAYLHEPCARRPGHRTEHRSAYALENQRRAKRAAA